MLGRTLPVLCVPSRGQSQGAWADGPCRERFEPVKEPSAGIKARWDTSVTLDEAPLSRFEPVKEPSAGIDPWGLRPV